MSCVPITQSWPHPPAARRQPQAVEFPNAAACRTVILAAQPESGYAKKFTGLVAAACDKRVEVARRWACHMDDCTRFEFAAIAGYLAHASDPDDQAQCRSLPSEKSDSLCAHSIARPAGLTRHKTLQEGFT
jgi:hypothetical protein